jgi:predicted nucleic acid-binding protein
MSKIILDTDVLIDLLRGREAARLFLAEATRDAVPCCSVISVAEIHAGMRPAERAPTSALLDALLIVPVTRTIAEWAGQFKARTSLRRLELADCLIAATAFTEAAPLATGNVRDYPMPEITVVPVRR